MDRNLQFYFRAPQAADEHITYITNAKPRLLEKLRKADTDKALINILNGYFSSVNEPHQSLADLLYMRKLLKALKRGARQKDKRLPGLGLYKQLVIHNFNHPLIIEYYLHLFRKTTQLPEHNNCETSSLLLGLSLEPPVDSYTCDLPTLASYVRGVINHRQEEQELQQMGFLKGKEFLPVLHFNTQPRIFMRLIRVMIETGLLKRHLKREEYFELLSQVIRGPDNQGYEPGTLSNNYVMGEVNIDDVEDVICYVNELRNTLKQYQRELEKKRAAPGYKC